MVPTVVPSGAENGAVESASPTLRIALLCTAESQDANQDDKNTRAVTRPRVRTLRSDLHQVAQTCIEARTGEMQARATILEPATTESTGQYFIAS